MAFTRRMALDAFTGAEQLARSGASKASAYPPTVLGQQLHTVAGMIKAGFGASVYYLTDGGEEENGSYDTHYGQAPRHAALLGGLASGWRSFLDDLDAARLADRVAILAYSEFGRRVEENASGGTDHGTAGPVLLAGGPVRGGLVGTTPKLLDLEDGDLKVGIDFRRVYATLLEDWLGLPSATALAGSFERLPLFRT
jgi:uncharacterized protein (DUF1501 family)